MTRLVASAATAGILTMGLPAVAHTPEELNRWEAEWVETVIVEGGLSLDLIADWRDMDHRHPDDDDATALTLEAAGHTTSSWESLIVIHFRPADHEWARRVMECESGGDPDATNPTSGAAGLFQFLPSTWTWASDHAGWEGSSPHDAQANVAVAADLYYWLGPTQWSCR